MSGRPVSIYTTRLTAQGGDSNLPNEVRARQAAECINFIRAERPPGGRAILMGDFNAEPILEFIDPQKRRPRPPYAAYATVTRYFRDVWALALPPRDPEDPTGDTVPKESKRVDYVFLRKGSRLNLVAVSVLNTFDLSDHFPVFARISFD